MQYVATPDQLSRLTHVGEARYNASRASGLSDKHGRKRGDTGSDIAADIAAAYAEWAFARHLGEEWQETVNTFKAPDHVAADGIRWQVRSTHREDGSIIFRNDDDKAHDWALMVGDCQKGFRFAGVVPGAVATDKAWGSTNDREPCWMIPQDALFTLGQMKAAKTLLATPLTAWGITLLPTEWPQTEPGFDTTTRGILRNVYKKGWGVEDAIATPEAYTKPSVRHLSEAQEWAESVRAGALKLF